MSRDFLDYNRLVENSLRGVVREALTRAATIGLPGNHHFFISFRTEHPGVDIADYLRQRHPEEMTIVIQHQYWGLDVAEDHFSVSLAFNKVRERLTVPFAAITAFADPSVEFGLQFRSGLAGRTAPPATLPAPSPAAAPATGAAASPAGETKAAKQESAEKKAAEIVTLDAFRKK
jgi:hypothetical protein